MKETSITTRSTASPYLRRCQIAGIGLFQQAHASVLTQTKVNLAVAGIDSNDPRRPALQAGNR